MDEFAGLNGIALSSVRFYLDDTGYFKSIKQVDFSVCSATGGCIGGGGQPAIPEPSTWAMLLMGFAGLGFAAYRRSTRTTALG